MNTPLLKKQWRRYDGRNTDVEVAANMTSGETERFGLRCGGSRRGERCGAGNGRRKENLLGRVNATARMLKHPDSVQSDEAYMVGQNIMIMTLF